MALDEPRDTDKVFDIDGFQYLIETPFLEKAKPIKVDFLVNGFKLDGNIDFGQTESACGGCPSASDGCG